MVGYDSKEDKIKHYRVDKMLKIKVESAKREGRQKFRQLDMAAYAKKMFNMFGGEEESVTIECTNNLSGVMIDRFGKDVLIMKVDEEHFKVCVKVAASNHFIHWVMSLGEGAKIARVKMEDEQGTALYNLFENVKNCVLTLETDLKGEIAYETIADSMVSNYR